jgi:hypothetical protein
MPPCTVEGRTRCGTSTARAYFGPAGMMVLHAKLVSTASGSQQGMLQHCFLSKPHHLMRVVLCVPLRSKTFVLLSHPASPASKLWLHVIVTCLAFWQISLLCTHKISCMTERQILQMFVCMKATVPSVFPRSQLAFISAISPSNADGGESITYQLSCEYSWEQLALSMI